MKVSRYFWVYITAPMLAAPLAGLLAKMHLGEVVKKNGMNPMRSASVFFKGQ